VPAPPGFAAWSTPEWTIVSGDPRDRLEAVESAYAARGGQVLHTANTGAVRVSIGRELEVSAWLESSTIQDAE
jgi:hypothetical protein